MNPFYFSGGDQDFYSLPSTSTNDISGDVSESGQQQLYPALHGYQTDVYGRITPDAPIPDFSSLDHSHTAPTSVCDPSSFDLLYPEQYQTPQPYHQYSSYPTSSTIASAQTQGSSFSPTNAQFELEALREQRRLRQSELELVAQRRRETEEVRLQREAQLAIITLERHRTSNQLLSSSLHSSANYASSPSSALSKYFPPPTDNVGYTPLASSSIPSSSTVDNMPSSHERSSSQDSDRANPDRPSSSPKPKVRKQALLSEHCDAICSGCSKSIAQLILRGTPSEIDVQYEPQFRCDTCSSSSHTRTTTRKRTNQLEDITLSTVCSVCTKIIGQGGFVAKEGRTPLSFTVEVICTACNAKYKRCTNCGGGSSRGGIGKWRCKELFEGNRKTCRLSHDRLGARDMELSVWEVPGDVEGKEEWPAVVDACESLWKDHYMARLGTPEVLEHSSSLRTFKDIEEKCMRGGYLGRNVWEEGPMTPNTRIYTALTWAKTRARRDKSAADWTKSSSEEKSMDKWIAFNTRWGDTLMPSNAILCANWFCEWNIRDRTLIFLSATPFDRQEVQERAAFSINATRMRVFADIEKHNREFPDDPWGHPLHIWTSLKYSVEPLRSRIVDVIQVKFQSLPLEEYLLRYPDTDRALFSASHTTIGRVVNEHPPADEQDKGLHIYVRHWGSDANVDALSKQMEGMLARKPRAYAE